MKASTSALTFLRAATMRVSARVAAEIMTRSSATSLSLHRAASISPGSIAISADVSTTITLAIRFHRRESLDFGLRRDRSYRLFDAIAAWNSDISRFLSSSVSLGLTAEICTVGRPSRVNMTASPDSARRMSSVNRPSASEIEISIGAAHALTFGAKAKGSIAPKSRPPSLRFRQSSPYAGGAVEPAASPSVPSRP